MNDLLAPNIAKAGGNTEKLTEETCVNIDQITSLIRMGDINRQLGATRVNERAEKATTILRIVVESFSYNLVEAVS